MPAYDAGYQSGSPLIQALLNATATEREEGTGEEGTSVGTGRGERDGEREGAVPSSHDTELRRNDGSTTSSGHHTPLQSSVPFTTLTSSQISEGLSGKRSEGLSGKLSVGSEPTPTTARSTTTIISTTHSTATDHHHHGRGHHPHPQHHNHPHIAKNESELHGLSLLVAEKVRRHSNKGYLSPSTIIYYHPHLPLPPCHNVANLTTLFSLLSMYLFFSLSYPSLSCSFYSYPLFLSLFFSFYQVRRQSIKGISVDDLLATVYPAGFADAAGGGADTRRTTDSDEDNEDNDDPSTSYHRSPSGAQGHGGKGGEKGGRGGSTRKLSYSPALHGQGMSTRIPSTINYPLTNPLPRPLSNSLLCSLLHNLTNPLLSYQPLTPFQFTLEHLLTGMSTSNITVGPSSQHTMWEDNTIASMRRRAKLALDQMILGAISTTPGGGISLSTTATATVSTKMDLLHSLTHPSAPSIAIPIDDEELERMKMTEKQHEQVNTLHPSLYISPLDVTPSCHPLGVIRKLHQYWNRLMG